MNNCITTAKSCDIINLRGANERFVMLDKHKTVIKWYEYDHSKLYEKVESEDVTDESADEPEVEQAEEEKASLTGDSDMDDEVARIMAAFSGAKQNSVDDVFAKMAEEENQDALVASICAPKQNNVDDLIMKARDNK